MSYSFDKVQYAEGKTVISGKNLNDIQEALLYCLANLASGGGGGGGSTEQMTGYAVTETDTSVTMVLTTENGSHTHVLNFDANGYPNSITVDGVAIPGTWEVAASE